MSQKENRHWVNLENGGCKLFGVMHHPVGVDSCPGVFICHGFGGNKCGKHRIYVRLAETLCKAGIAVLRIDFRGCGDSEGDFRDITLAGEVSDAMMGLKYLIDHSKVDASRIGVAGRSLGGAIAVMAANRLGNAKGLALWSPVFTAKQWKQEWQEHQKRSIGPIDAEYIRFNGKPTTTKFIKEFFNMKLESDMQALANVPLIHFHGEQDDTVFLKYHADEYERCRKNSAAESTFVRLPNSDHDFLDIDERDQMVVQTAKWFKYIL